MEKIYGWVTVVMGSFTIFNWVYTADSDSLLGGGMFLVAGLIILNQAKKLEAK